MKRIQIPEDLTVKLQTKEGGTSVTIKFKEFIVNALDGYQPNGKSVKQIRQMMKIIDKVEKADGTILLDVADYDIIKASLHLEGDGGSWMPNVARQVISFFDAVEQAEEVTA